ncbi:MAG: acetylglutamate kinase [Phycisphaera sp.]|nr:acetylglutamate kinase [Phycisphaera sp.]
MQEAIEKARVLIEAHEYIRQFENKVIVVKVGGSIMDDPNRLTALLRDVCFLDAVNIRPVLVHGGGKSISQAMAAEGLEAQFVQGRRYTDERTLTIAEHVLVNEVNKFIVDTINQFEHKAMGLHSLASCVIFGKRLYLKGEEGRKIDVGYVGEVETVNTELLKAMVESDYIPVIAPIARDRSGGKLNVNADSAAGEVAAALKAEKLVLVSDTHGIRTGATDDTLASHLTKSQIEKLVDGGVISEGMLPKVEACFTSLAAGVHKTHIIDGRIPHSLLLEIFSAAGIGTEIVMD